MSSIKQPTTLLEAAKKFAEESFDQSTMRQVVIHFAKQKEATRLLLKELDLVSKELS